MLKQMKMKIQNTESYQVQETEQAEGSLWQWLHLRTDFVQGKRWFRARFNFFAFKYPVSSAKFIEETVCFQYAFECFWFLCHESIGCRCMDLFEVLLLFHWSMYLFLSQYQAVLVNIAKYYVLKLGILLPPLLFFLFHTTLFLGDVLCFHMNYFFYFSEECHWYFYGDYSESINYFEQYEHFDNISSSP